MLLIPCVITVSLVGAYALHGDIGDVFVAAFFGVLGFVMIRFDYPRITLVIAFVLSGLMERNFIQSMIMFEGNWQLFFADRTTLILVLLTLCALRIPAVSFIRSRRSVR
jgi:putative tricarboxylic transport membrane protein